MAGGGSAQAMKISDVFILVGISILVAGFIMHAWVSSEAYEFEGEDIETVEKSFVLFKNDKLDLEVTIPSEHSVTVIISKEGVSTELEPISESLSDVLEIDSTFYKFTADSSGEYMMFIEFEPNNGNASFSMGEIFVDVQRNLFIDFLPYPIGAISLAFGIHKRKEENSSEVIDAEID